MTAGEKIRKRRLELGITQKDVARMIGTTNAYVSAVEKQKRGGRRKRGWQNSQKFFNVAWTI
jgi:transcriptional regulator with XRE-family HTH domain